MTLDVAMSQIVDNWMELAIANIDQRFGDGFAKANPDLLGSYIQSIGAAYQSHNLADKIEPALHDLRSALGDIRETIANLE